MTTVEAVLQSIFTGLGHAPAPAVALGLGLVMVIDTLALLGLLVPADVLVISAAAAVDPRAAPLLAAGATVGSLTGWSVSFAIGRCIGPALQRSALARMVTRQRWASAARLLAGDSGRGLVLLQFLPVVNALVPALAGAVGMSYRRFMGYAGISAVMWATVFTKLGVSASSVGPAVPLLAGALTIAVLVAAWAVRRVRGAPPPANTG
ncbi:membrane protein DedA, SNARE-associated domain [Pseudonocardia ammonioxydans]|uniref:Membrane protein DedA, SNARE-associated domain n=1 Tax=Pseudonocardia ammonioxydans TaxID=260086 RepID=A0A1I5IFX5_PSUAM|nr:VTT domain-containing protein [Pseudonocardia ammonioxydans]SFO59588.1 membrane protein DedA, SNARE-associated domain [Pseudonocardia ammonioxydans]